MTTQSAFDVELPNVGPGGDPFSLSDCLERPHVDTVVMLFQRDYYCGNCRRQVKALAERYEEFQAQNALVVSLLPEPRTRAANWRETYDLPFPLLADPEKEVQAAFDQPVRFGPVGRMHDLIGRMPKTIVVDVSSESMTPVFTHDGSHPADRPTIDELLEQCRAVDEE